MTVWVAFWNCSFVRQCRFALAGDGTPTTLPWCQWSTGEEWLQGFEEQFKQLWKHWAIRIRAILGAVATCALWSDSWGEREVWYFQPCGFGQRIRFDSAQLGPHGPHYCSNRSNRFYSQLGSGQSLQRTKWADRRENSGRLNDSWNRRCQPLARIWQLATSVSEAFLSQEDGLFAVQPLSQWHVCFCALRSYCACVAFVSWFPLIHCSSCLCTFLRIPPHSYSIFCLFQNWGCKESQRWLLALQMEAATLSGHLHFPNSCACPSRCCQVLQMMRHFQAFSSDGNSLPMTSLPRTGKTSFGFRARAVGSFWKSYTEHIMRPWQLQNDHFEFIIVSSCFICYIHTLTDSQTHCGTCPC